MDLQALDSVTLIVPFYRNCAMLVEQIRTMNAYPEGLRVLIVDDGSPEPALPLVQSYASEGLRGRLELYRILEDIPWNREGARNLATLSARTPWVVHVDIDHVLPAPAAADLLRFRPQSKRWYRFPRWRVGAADETRQKDALAPDCPLGQIHPHIDSYLIQAETYWAVGGYDEDFSGCLGGGTDFLKRLEAHAGAPLMLPPEVVLRVHTRHAIKDASDWSLSRDTSEGKKRARAKRDAGATRPKSHIRFSWVRQL